MHRLLAAATLSIGVSAAAADSPVTVENISIKLVDAFEPGAAVSGALRIPATRRDRVPAVLILHSTPGFDGRGDFYAEGLNRAGIATLEADYLHGHGMPATPRHNLPHAYETLRFLAAQPRIDPARIGILGFSWGGILALLTSSEQLTQQYTAGKARFAAHLGLYPICWMQRGFAAGTTKHFDAGVYRRVTGSPVQILSAGKDDYDDDPESCARFLGELSPEVRSHFSLTTYSDATFAWDSRFSSATYNRGAKKATGGIVTIVADPVVAAHSRDFVVAFFTQHLGAD